MQKVIDLVNDLIIELSARRGRVLLILLAIMLSTGALVASIGISNTAAKQIDADLAASSTDRLSIETVSSALEESAIEASNVTMFFPPDAEDRVATIRTVIAGGLWIPMGDSELSRGSGDATVVGLESNEFLTIGATSAYLDAVGAQMPSAWMLDHDNEYSVALIGTSVAKALEIPLGLENYTGYRVHVDGVAYDVLGIISGANRASLENSVVLPYGTVVAQSRSSDSEAQMFVFTEPGAGSPVSEVIRQVLRPDAPETLRVSSVADLETLRTGVSSQLSQLAGAIGVILLALTALLIANSMIVSVIARTAEIGLRRALGASRGAITVLFLADGALVGILGGIAGSAFGAAAVVVVAWVSDWTASLNPMYLVAGPVVGLVIGTLASAYPALQAGRVSPADAVRSE